ncbi:hypothetical protein [Photobacterium sp. OFAV2-7]|uniref:hypothetical protein n=1 Tax=Photobacterium sp. OFAV2-7 TaxID=2917748 RepID=UPI001EF432CA|nr:hypothetical protein [Photobacterium sp. OFAV2-7]MCG7584799.1 hypothetical protein [Photobacterium sp. OFAV2-7]
MNLYLDATLAAHRRGRFLIGLLDACALDDNGTRPHSGFIMMTGKEFQSLEPSQQSDWWLWCTLPGRVLLLLPPFRSGSVYHELDWTIKLSDGIADTEQPGIAQTVAFEVDQEVVATQGVSDRGAGHRWDDQRLNTRYFKAHSASGVFAVTCLPLWSIGLMDQPEAVASWLDVLDRVAGQAEELSDSYLNENVPHADLEPTDYTVMVCLYGWQLIAESALLEHLAQQTIPLVSLSQSEVSEGMSRLISNDFLTDAGLTESGLAALQASPYWDYALQLKEQSV